MPDWTGGIRRRLGAAALRPEREAEIVEEIAQHLADRYQSLLALGASPQDAEQGAWRELEEANVIGHRIAEIETAPVASLTALEANRRGGMVVGLWPDTRYAIRALFKRPLLSITAVISIACSLGPATAVLGIAETLFFRPLPGIARQDRLVNYMFGVPAERDGISPWTISYANENDLTHGATTVAAMAGVQPLSSVGLAVPDVEPQLVGGAAVSANYFDVLSVHPTAGRTFIPEEDRTPGGVPVVVLSEGRARDFFGSPQAAVGKTVLVNSVPFTVIGVAPTAFVGTNAERRVEFWIPGMAYKRAMHFPPQRWGYELNAGPFYAFVVRMTDAATVTQTTDELSARTRALAERDPRLNARFQTVRPILQPGFAAPPSTRLTAFRAVQLMSGVAALLVLLGLANVANLLLFRGVAGARDIATRKTLGASTRRLLQLRLVESLLLSFGGALLGVGIAIGLGVCFSGFNVPAIGSIDVTIDWRVLTATACLSIVVGIGFGLAPALLAARSSVSATLGRGAWGEIPRATRLRHTLAVAQVALSLSLLIGALLFLSTLRNLHAVDLGFDATGMVVSPLNLRVHGYTEARAVDYEQRLSDALRREPGVQSVTLAYSPPLFGMTFSSRVYMPGADPKTATQIPVNAIDNEYFRTLNLPLARGRALTHDEAFGIAHGDQVPVVLSETLARALFGSIDVEGRQLLMPQSQAAPSTLRVVGVARQAHFRAVDEPPDPILYMPLAQFPAALGGYLIVRSTFSPEAAGQLIARAARAIDPAVPVAPDRTFGSIINLRLGQQRLFAWLLGLLASIGFLLSAVGLHGLVSQTVIERRREFGIRLAIGAEPRQIMRSVLRRGAVLGASGLAAGLTLAWMAGRVLESRLFGVTSRDPGVYAVAALTMALIVAAATAIPARAATQVDPVDVLKQE
jgi:predicted permease